MANTLPKNVIASVHAALSEVATERLRQVLVEGFTASHDDEHVNGELADAAACYALNAALPVPKLPPPYWPWARSWWKPATRRDDLVKAAALLVAEIERLDRLSPLETEE